MPFYDLYEGDTTYVKGGLEGNTEYGEDPDMDTGLDCHVPTSEVNDNYVNASGMSPRRKGFDIGKFIRRKVDAYGNAVGKKNDNPILDTK